MSVIQPSLLTPKAPPTRVGIDLRYCSCGDPAFVEASQGAALVIADPPWTYARALRDEDAANTGQPSDYYPTLTPDEIAAHLHALPSPALAVWLTWPLLAEWTAAWSLSPVTRRWTSPGALIVDPYAGLGSVAEAVLMAGEGRRYLGAEIDPERHASALALIAQVRA